MSEKRTDDEVHVEARHSCRGENKTNDMKSTEMKQGYRASREEWTDGLGTQSVVISLRKSSFLCLLNVKLCTDSLRVFLNAVLLYSALYFWFTQLELLIKVICLF